jgi:hypothetical protein
MNEAEQLREKALRPSVGLVLSITDRANGDRSYHAKQRSNILPGYPMPLGTALALGAAHSGQHNTEVMDSDRLDSLYLTME